MEQTPFEDLYKKMEVLLEKVDAIETTVSSMKTDKNIQSFSPFPLVELLSFKKELEAIKLELQIRNSQPLDITVYHLLKELSPAITEIRESTGFIKNIFTQEKLKPTKKRVSKQERVNTYLKKYVKTMK